MIWPFGRDVDDNIKPFIKFAQHDLIQQKLMASADLEDNGLQCTIKWFSTAVSPMAPVSLYQDYTTSIPTTVSTRAGYQDTTDETTTVSTMASICIYHNYTTSTLDDTDSHTSPLSSSRYETTTRWNKVTCEPLVWIGTSYGDQFRNQPVTQTDDLAHYVPHAEIMVDSRLRNMASTVSEVIPAPSEVEDVGDEIRTVHVSLLEVTQETNPHVLSKLVI